MKYILFVCTVCCAFILSAQQKKAVVISSDPNSDVPKNVVQLFIDALDAGLIESGRYEVIGNRAEQAKISREEMDSYDAGIVDDREQVEFGKNSGAQYTCFVSITEVFGTYTATCKFRDFATGKTLATIVEATNDYHDIARLARKIAKKIETGRDYTSEQRLKWVKAPECYYDNQKEKYVDCDISISDEDPLTYSEAVTFCKNKGEDWRLPDKEELKKIYYFRYAIEGNGGAKFAAKDYWSSSKRNNYESFILNFGTGKENYYSVNISNPFRCIRY